MTAQELATKLLAFYDNKPERWTQNQFARDAAGEKAEWFKEDAVCWCALGGLLKLGAAEGDTLLANSFGYGLLAAFNDECADFNAFKTKLEELANGPG